MAMIAVVTLVHRQSPSLQVFLPTRWVSQMVKIMIQLHKPNLKLLTFR